MIQWFSGVWEVLVEPAQMEDARKRQLSRILNIILLVLLFWGIAVEVLNRSAGGLIGTGDISILTMLVVLGLAYYFNRKGYFLSATVLTLGLFVSATFASALLQYLRGKDDLSVLYYLIVAILIGESLLSIRGYLTLAFIVLAGVFGMSLLNSAAETIFFFMFVFCTLITFSTYNRRLIESRQIALAGKFTREQSLLSIEQRRSAQLGLLEEAGRQISASLDEKEIVQRAVEAIVNRFGYAIAAVSLLVRENVLEIAAISGTQDYGYQPGYQQELGSGIIGHVGKARMIYIANNVQEDPYYFSSAAHEGSAIAVPISDEKELIGVLYVESTDRDSFQTDDAQTMYALANQVASSIQRARLYASSQEHLRIVSIVQSISHIIASSLDLDEIFRTVVQKLKDTLGYTYVSIYILREDTLHLGAQSGYPAEQVIERIHISEGVTGRTVMTRQAQFISDVSQDPGFLRAADEIHSEICVPLLKNDNVLGTLNVEADASLTLRHKDLELLSMLAGTIALAVDNARLHSQVKEMAMTDAVSGLSNRHVFEESLNAEVVRAHRFSHPLSLIIFDLDSFKDFNDLWGHPEGDIRLRATAQLIRTNLRQYDISARYGGDEFAIILPNTEKHGALQFARRLLAAAQASTSETPLEGKGVPGHTLSIGIATFPQDGNTVASLLLAADQAELTAKRLGKNRIFAASDRKDE